MDWPKRENSCVVCLRALAVYHDLQWHGSPEVTCTEGQVGGSRRFQACLLVLVWAQIRVQDNRLMAPEHTINYLALRPYPHLTHINKGPKKNVQSRVSAVTTHWGGPVRAKGQEVGRGGGVGKGKGRWGVFVLLL